MAINAGHSNSNTIVLWKTKMDWKRLLVLMVANIVYLLLGGAAFQALEKEGKEHIHSRTRINRTEAFLDIHRCISEEELDTFIKQIISAYDSGILVVDNSTSVSDWNFPSSVFFSGTVVTTIGYGDMSPSTTGGRIFCMVYAIFGIPLMLVFLRALGEKLSLLAETVDPQLDFYKGRPKVAKGLRLGFLLILGVILLLFVPAVIFMEVEDWTYIDSLYYGVITLTTVGLGDFVPGRDGTTMKKTLRDTYRLCIWCWIFIGLAWLSTLFSALQELLREITNKVEMTVMKHSKRIIAKRYHKKDSVHTVEAIARATRDSYRNAKPSNGKQVETPGEVFLKNMELNDSDQPLRVTRL